MRLARVLGTSTALGFGQDALGVNIPLESSEKRGSRRGRGYTWVMGCVKAESADSPAQRHVGGIEWLGNSYLSHDVPL
jgi:hypothetical protein